MSDSVNASDSVAPDPSEETLAQDAESLRRSVQLSSLTEQAQVSAPGYRVLRKLGEGKFGSVWLAREQNTGKQVAIKFYATRRGVDWALLSREVEKLAVLYTSRNIVGLLGVGWDHDPPYYVMEYLERGSLAGLLEQGPLSVAESVRLATRVAQALVHAHGSGILHCDLKPANVLLDADLEPRLCDFGQSRLADEHAHALGTLFYMAPEQADLKAVPDARWDVYALGALMYHMLCGAPPYRSPEADARLKDARTLEDRLAEYRRLVKYSPRPTQHRKLPGVDTSLADIIDRCLSSDPHRRYPNAQAVLDRLTARERQRARRPLLFLGLVLPLLLLAGVTPLALRAMQIAVGTAQENVIARAIESDRLSVNLLARSIERELEDRLNELLVVAEDEELAELVAKYSGRPQAERLPMWEWLDRQKKQIDAKRRAQSRPLDASWFLVDAAGVQRWRQPISDETIDQNFSHRDYYHGRNQDFPAGQAPAMVAPLDVPHVSIAYQSTNTRKYVIALAVPVFDAQRKNVLGVLARTAEMSQLLLDYERGMNSSHDDATAEKADDTENVNRVLALIDSRKWHILTHPGLKDRASDEIDFTQLQIEPRLRESLQEMIQLEPGKASSPDLDWTEQYRDPVARLQPRNFGGDWLAAFSLVGNHGWIAVVQERRDRALKPVDELRAEMAMYGAWGALLSGGLIGACWWFLTRLIHDRSARGRRAWTSGWKEGMTGGTSTQTQSAVGASLAPSMPRLTRTGEPSAFVAGWTTPSSVDDRSDAGA